MFNDKMVLITGGTGSFGKHFVKVLLENYKPKKVIVYSRDELKQFEMQQVFGSPVMRYFLGDVRDEQRMTMAMRGVDYVVHAAALKQVPAAEYNPMECIKTNVLGAQNVIQAAIKNQVQKVIALSTDKAANPINLYGATKLCSDKLFVAANCLSGEGPTRFSVVRYGNVIGSRGSVVPYFQTLAKQNAVYIPITDSRMTRFWITLQQGVDFVVSSFSRMHGGEIFIPKIPSAYISDIADAIAPGIPKRVVGIRPGEKIHEIMCTKDDAVNTIEFSGHYVIKPSIHMWTEIDYSIDRTHEQGEWVLKEFEYTSGSNGVFLDLKEIQRLVADYLE